MSAQRGHQSGQGQPQSIEEATTSSSRDELVGRVGAALESMAPPGVRTGVRAIDAADEDLLLPGERDAIARAVPLRRVEFATGRGLLRELIGRNEEIPMADDRRPRFPAGVVGTLAHDRDIAVAATTTLPEYRALGIDIEPDTVLDDQTARVIRRPEERHLDAHLVFVLKEAAYKAWSSTGGRILEHHDVRVTIDSPDAFRAEVLAEGARMTGRFAAVADRYVALVTLDERGEPGSGRELRRRA